jgi:hypothetical protein
MQNGNQCFKCSPGNAKDGRFGSWGACPQAASTRASSAEVDWSQWLGAPIVQSLQPRRLCTPITYILGSSPLSAAQSARPSADEGKPAILDGVS